MTSSSRPLAVVVQLSEREPSDAALVTRARAGVSSAREALYGRHVGRALALCLRLLGDRDEAEDVLQESFGEALERLAELRDPSQFARFLAGIAVQRADALYRQRRTRRFVHALSPATDGLSFLCPLPQLETEPRAQLLLLDSLLAQLRDRDRAAWLLHDVDGYTLAEIARMVARPLGIVKRRYARAERSLRGAAIPRPLDRLLDERRPAHARQLLHAFQARRELRARRGKRSSRALMYGTGLLLVVALGGLALGDRAASETLPLAMRDQRRLPSALLTEGSYHAFDLSDGSRITLAASTRVDVLKSSARELILALRHGRVRFDLQARGPRVWRIESGELSVELVGSKLVMARSERALRVSVEAGAVVLRGEQVPDRVQRLSAGESFVAE